jgi:Bax protein
VESGWGKSRFAKKANNLFGYWEYSDNGIKPKSKYDYIKINYSLKVFPSLEDSIATYMLNLNRNPAYKSFRKLRALYRKEHKVFTGKVAAKTLLYYSQKREAYIKTLQSLIKNNDWSKYDNLSY